MIIKGLMGVFATGILGFALVGCYAEGQAGSGVTTKGNWGGCRLQGRVVKVADGDTVTVLGAGNQQFRVRLAGIDAPEKKQAFGQVSKDTLASMVAGQMVCVDWNKQDQYQRYIGNITVNGVAVNLRMVQQGMAWHYKQYANEQTPADRAAYSAAEVQARQSRAGLWVDGNPLAPWDFRKMQKGG